MRGEMADALQSPKGRAMMERLQNAVCSDYSGLPPSELAYVPQGVAETVLQHHSLSTRPPAPQAGEES